VICFFNKLSGIDPHENVVDLRKGHGCPRKGHFRAKTAKNAVSSSEMPFIGQPDNQNPDRLRHINALCFNQCHFNKDHSLKVW